MAWKTLETPQRRGSQFVRYGDLTEGDVVVEGSYLERRPSNFSTEEDPKFDHVFEMTDGSTKVLNSCSELNYKLDLVDFGTVTRVVYSGKETVNGKKGVFNVHRFQVDIEGEAGDGPF